GTADRELDDEVGHLVGRDVRGAEAARPHRLREYDGAHQAEDTGERGQHGDDQCATGDPARYPAPARLALVFLGIGTRRIGKAGRVGLHRSLSPRQTSWPAPHRLRLSCAFWRAHDPLYGIRGLAGAQARRLTGSVWVELAAARARQLGGQVLADRDRLVPGRVALGHAAG